MIETEMNRIQKFLANPYRVFSYLGSKNLLAWLPDELYLKLVFRGTTGERLNLDYPESFNEKIQWLKIHDRNPRYTILVDKYLAKDAVSKVLGPEVIVPTLGVWESASLIELAQLPEQFVLKANHNSGPVFICRDKAVFDFAGAVASLNKQIAKSYFTSTREWPYKDVAPLVFAEKFLNSAPDSVTVVGAKHDNLEKTPQGIIDYKFYCFHGEPKFLFVSQGMEDQSSGRTQMLNIDWTESELGRSDYQVFDQMPTKPKVFNEMLDAARRLSRDIPFVRVDLFEHEGRIQFSEMTFHPASGMMAFSPKEADQIVGRYLDLGQVEISKMGAR